MTVTKIRLSDRSRSGTILVYLIPYLKLSRNVAITDGGVDFLSNIPFSGKTSVCQASNLLWIRLMGYVPLCGSTEITKKNADGYI